MSKVIGMNTKIKFDREIDKDKHYISIGGFEFGIGKDTVQFDFNSSYGYINEDDNKIISFNLEYLDEESFKNCGDKLTKDFCKNIDNIEEFFFIYTGEYDDPEIFPIEILNVEFIFDDGEIIPINEKVIKEYNKIIEHTY